METRLSINSYLHEALYARDAEGELLGLVQGELDWRLRAEDVVKEFAVVVVGLEALLDAGAALEA